MDAKSTLMGAGSPLKRKNMNAEEIEEWCQALNISAEDLALMTIDDLERRFNHLEHTFRKYSKSPNLDSEPSIGHNYPNTRPSNSQQQNQQFERASTRSYQSDADNNETRYEDIASQKGEHRTRKLVHRYPLIEKHLRERMQQQQYTQQQLAEQQYSHQHNQLQQLQQQKRLQQHRLQAAQLNAQQAANQETSSQQQSSQQLQQTHHLFRNQQQQQNYALQQNQPLAKSQHSQQNYQMPTSQPLQQGQYLQENQYQQQLKSQKALQQLKFKECLERERLKLERENAEFENIEDDSVEVMQEQESVEPLQTPPLLQEAAMERSVGKHRRSKYGKQYASTAANEVEKDFKQFSRTISPENQIPVPTKYSSYRSHTVPENYASSPEQIFKTCGNRVIECVRQYGGAEPPCPCAGEEEEEEEEDFCPQAASSPIRQRFQEMRPRYRNFNNYNLSFNEEGIDEVEQNVDIEEEPRQNVVRVLSRSYLAGNPPVQNNCQGNQGQDAAQMLDESYDENQGACGGMTEPPPPRTNQTYSIGPRFNETYAMSPPPPQPCNNNNNNNRQRSPCNRRPNANETFDVSNGQQQQQQQRGPPRRSPPRNFDNSFEQDNFLDSSNEADSVYLRRRGQSSDRTFDVNASVTSNTHPGSMGGGSGRCPQPGQGSLQCPNVSTTSQTSSPVRRPYNGPPPGECTPPSRYPPGQSRNASPPNYRPPSTTSNFNAPASRRQVRRPIDDEDDCGISSTTNY